MEVAIPLIEWSRNMETETKQKEKVVKKKRKLKFKIRKLTLLMMFLDIAAIVILFFIYGPVSYFRELWITSAMTTMNHHYLAYTFFNERTITEVMNKNYLVEQNEEVDLDAIVIGNTQEKDSYSSIYEEQVLKREEGNSVYKIIRLDEDGIKGYLTVIYDPQDVQLAVTNKIGRVGQSVAQLCREHNGLVGINGGGFEDLDGWGNGSIPYGAIIQNGELIYYHEGGDGGLIGFTKEHKMWLTRDSAEDAVAKGMRDAVEFGPFLIVNGKPAEIHGDGGWGVAPRTVIAQRKDGIVLFLIIEGRLPGYALGADMEDVIRLLLRYKAYNAANLDGGASSTMAVNGKLYNRPSAGGEYGGRTVSNAWIVVDHTGNMNVG